MIDGGLRKTFQRRLRDWHWQAIETGGTGLGIPDLNGCRRGHEVWLELKATASWKVIVNPEQVGWAEARMRAGGNVYMAVRQQGSSRDKLWLLSGEAARPLRMGMRLDLLPSSLVLGFWDRGEAFWDWKSVDNFLSA